MLQTGAVVIFLDRGAELGSPTAKWKMAKQVQQVSQDLHTGGQRSVVLTE